MSSGIPDVVAHESGGGLVVGVQDPILIERLRQVGFQHVVQRKEGIVFFPGNGALLEAERIVKDYFGGTT